MSIKRVKYIVLDVDGTMTDGSIYYDENGNELKKFNTKDAAGFFAAKQVGIKTIVLTGRECVATKRRMEEMKVDYLFQNVKNKADFLLRFMQESGIKQEELGYIGDDLNDYESMKLAGMIACPCDACEEVKSIADYISPYKGGDQVIRDVIEVMLRTSGEWEKAISKAYGIGI